MPNQIQTGKQTQHPRWVRFLYTPNAFWTGIAIFILVFLITRLCYFTTVQLPYAFDDAPSYAVVIDDYLNEGELIFAHRTAGYPLFLLFSYLISPAINMIVYLQAIFTLVSGIFLIWAFRKTFPALALPAALAIAIFISSTAYLHHESAILTESLYASLFLFLTGFLMLAFVTNRIRYWVLSGLLIMPVIFVKPIGVVLFAFVGLIVLYQLIRRFSWLRIAAFLTPVVALYLALAFYNLHTLGQFTINEAHGKKFLAFVHPVLTSLEQDEEYPEEINNLIAGLHEKLPKEHKKLVANSWDLKKLRFKHLQNKKHFREFMQDYRGLDTDFSMRTVAMDALKEHPDRYVKWFVTMMAHYYRSFDPEERFTYPFLKNSESCYKARISRYFYSDINKQGRFMYYYAPRMTVRKAEQKLDALEEKAICSFNQQFSKFHNAVFQNLAWVYLYVIALIYAAIKYLRSRLKDKTSFVVLLVLLFPLATAVSYSLVHTTFIRYTYPLSFTYYLAPVFLAAMLPETLLKTRKTRKKSKKGKKK